MDLTLWPYISTLIRAMWWKVALALALMICLSLTEGIGLLMLVPLLQLVGMNVQQGTLGQIAQFLSSVFTAVGIRPIISIRCELKPIAKIPTFAANSID